VATDQKTSTLGIDPESPDSVIENELSTYRAISTQAIYSVVCGALAIFSWAHPLFYLASVLAVVLGVLSHRAIRRYPDMLTGHGLANVGITLGLIFGLGSVTYSTVQTYVRTNLAQRFARHYAEVIQSKPLADVLILHTHPDGRKDKSGEDLVKQMDTATAKDKMMVEQKYGPLLSLRKRLESSKEQHIEFARIESVGEDDSHGSTIPIYALAVFDVHGPASKEFPDETQYVLAILKGRYLQKQYDWWIDDIRYPYKPLTYVAPTKAPDDGHGHAH
jgi:hypothetical protein